jgi:uncharacterized membrane protein YqgA involved in biofilm formation
MVCRPDTDQNIVCQEEQMGTIINGCAIIVGGMVGLLFRRRFPEKVSRTALQVMGLLSLLVGIRMAIQGEEFILVVISLACGAMVGEWIDIEDRLEKLGLWLEKRFHVTEGSPAKGFIQASLLFCVGSMAIIGSITDGLKGDSSILVTKAMLDGIISIPFTAVMGIGVLGSALPVLIYQGSMTLLASKVQAFFTPVMIRELTSVGGVIVMGIGVNIMGLQKVRVGNLIPSLVLIVLLLYVKAFFG